MTSDQKNDESSPAKEARKKEDVTPPAKEDHKKDNAPVSGLTPVFSCQIWELLVAIKKLIFTLWDFVCKIFLKLLEWVQGHDPSRQPLEPIPNATPQSHPVQNIVLIGRTGDGKSATGNSIARQKVFITITHATEVTQKCQTFRVVTPEGPILNLIDTPGLLDMSVAPDIISKEILRCLTLAEGGLHAVILVITAKTQLSQEENMIFRTLEVLFGSKIFDYVIIVFSGGDVFEDDDVMTLKEYLDDSPDFIKGFLTLCGQRMTLFDNKTKDDVKKAKQVHELLNLMDLVKKQNSDKPYTNVMYLNIKEENEKHKKEEELQALMKELHQANQQMLKAIEEMKENARRKKEQEELESKRRSEKQFEELLKTNQHNFKEMEEVMEKTIKKATEAQEELFEIRLMGMVDRLDQMERTLARMYGNN